MAGSPVIDLYHYREEVGVEREATTPVRMPGAPLSAAKAQVSGGKLSSPPRPSPANWHSMVVADTLAVLGVDAERGLSTAEAARRLLAHGPNRLAEKKNKSLLARFFAQFADALIYILLAAAVVSALLGEVSDAVIILVVVLINAIVGVIQEARAEKSLEALKRLSAPRALVVRDGTQREIDAADLVPGDLVVIDAGRILPCDLRWIEAVNLKVDEASLTGESVPAEKEADALVDPAGPLGDRRNMGYLSTIATYGRGRGVAVATGMSTELGRIASLIAAEPDEVTPLQRKLADFGKMLGYLVLGLCAFMFLLAIGRELLRLGTIPSGTLFELFLTSVSLAVAAIPEGLPAIVTIVLAIGVQAMSRENAIVRRLPSVEALGSVTMICSDKTGTLTQNRMRVVTWSTKDLSGIGTEGGQARDIDLGQASQRLLVEALVLCNDASLGASGAIGDPTETALLEFAARYGVRQQELLAVAPRISEYPFDSARKMMSTVHERDGARIVMTKGAADRLLGLCDRAMGGNGEVPLDEKGKAAIIAEAEVMAGRALRVLGAAFRPMREGEVAVGAELELGLVFLGLVGMMDPPRLEVRASIATCKASGIEVAMITGDHKATALAIAQELGLAEREDEALSGSEIDALDDAALAEKARSARVFARVSPEHKVRIVKAFRSLGHVVSMTGDGVNDAPSLKAADIGVAMGITGTDVAKGASGIVLADDNFATIVRAVEEGRNIYANIRKAILFLLSCNLGEILCIFLPILFGQPIPLLPVHLLWVNLVTDTFPALALGMDPGDPDIMKERPRASKEGLLARGGSAFILLNGLVKGGLTLAAFWIGLALGGGGEAGLALARTMAFCVLSLTQLFHAFNSRHLTKSLFSIGVFGNRWLIAAFAVGAALQTLVVLVPSFAFFFKVLPLDAGQWAIVWLLSASTVVLNELAKLGLRLAGAMAARKR